MPRIRNAAAAAAYTAERQKAGSRLARQIRAGDKQVYLPPIGSVHVCWCERPAGHDWPGKADGASHPPLIGDGSPPHVTQSAGD